MRVALAALALIFFSNAASAAAHYPAPYTCSRNFYVSTAGVDTPGCGGGGFAVVTGAATCATMNGANNNIALQAGDCVNYAPGTYSVTTQTLTKGGSSNQASGYVTHVGAPNQTTKFSYTGGFYGLVIHTNYVIVDGFEFAGNNALGDAFMTTFDNANGGICQVNAAHHLMLINNLVHDVVGGGMGTNGGDYFIFAGNTIHDVSQCTPFGESAIHLLWPQAIPGFVPTLPWDTQFYHIQYIDNTTYNNFVHSAGSIPGGTCLNWSGDASGVNADNWQLQNFGPSGCTRPNPGMYPYHGIMIGNLSYGNGNRGISANSGHNMDMYNNTTYNNGQNTISAPPANPSSAPYDAESQISGDNFGFFNNIVVAGSASLEQGKTMNWTGAYGFPEGPVTVHNNIFYNQIGTNGINMQGTQNDAANLASITAASSNNFLAVNPLFNSIANFDFHPQGNSPAVGHGAPIPTGILPNQPTTNDGFAFSSPPPIGAFNTAQGSIASVPGPVSVVAGGTAAAPYVADAGFNGGNAGGPCNCGTIDTSLTVNPPPQGALNFQRFGQPQFSYVVSGLAPANTYMSNLYFIEFFDTGAGQRQENVSINGQQVLSNFDIFATAGAQHKVVQRSFFNQPDGSGNITLQLNAIAGLADGNAVISAFQVLNTTAGPVSISAGGVAAAPFIADAGFSGGTATGPGGWTTDLSLIPSPPPSSIFQYQRFGSSFYYVVRGLTPGQTYQVNLFFSEDYPPDGSVGQRIENVTLNGSASLVNFDIFAAAGALHKGVQKSFPILADTYGAITALFQVAAGSVDPNAEVDGIQVLSNVGSPPVAQNQSVSTPFQTAVQINLGSGATNSPTSAAIVGTPVGGNVALSGLNATFTPTAGFSGAASFQFTLANSNGISSTATASISVGGPVVTAPVAANKNLSTQFQTPVSTDLSANATNGPTSVSIVSTPANGTLSLMGFVATYTPNTGFSGLDSFSFTLANSGGTSNVATTTITVNPQVATTCP